MPDKPNDNKESWISRLIGSSMCAYMCNIHTRIELPDELLRSAKMAAAERGSTFRELVMQGLRQVLREAAEKPDASRLPKLPQRGRKAYDLSNEEIESLLMAEDAKRYGRSC